MTYTVLCTFNDQYTWVICPNGKKSMIKTLLDISENNLKSRKISFEKKSPSYEYDRFRRTCGRTTFHRSVRANVCPTSVLRPICKVCVVFCANWNGPFRARWLHKPRNGILKNVAVTHLPAKYYKYMPEDVYQWFKNHQNQISLFAVSK
jgi:hypothetical protein